jgi:hypothetical protein
MFAGYGFAHLSPSFPVGLIHLQDEQPWIEVFDEDAITRQ